MSATFSAAGPALQTAALLLAKSTLLLGMAALGALALRRASAASRHLLWSLALGALLALPALTLAVPAWKPALLAVVPASAAEAAPIAEAASAGPVRFASNGDAAPTVRTTSDDASSPLIGVLLAVWAVGAAVVLARLALGLWGTRRLARGAREMDDAAWAALAARLGEAAGVRRPVRLLLSPRAAMPMTWGTLRPVVLLPAEAVEWSEERRRVVLLHELAHVARRDCLTQALATVCCALWWPHPGAWWAARRLRQEREQACDDRVLAAGARASAYAGHLLDVARAFRAPALSGAALAMARPTQLEGRVLAVLDAERSRREVSVRAGAVCAAAALLALLPLAAVSPSERDGGRRPAPARKKVSLVVPFQSRADATGVARGRASVETRVDDVDIRLDVDFHVTLAQTPTAAAPPPASGPAWRRPGPADPSMIRQVSTGGQELGEMAPFVVSELIRASRDRASEVRRGAVQALGAIDHTSVVGPLIASLNDADPEVRAAAVRALGGITNRALALMDDADATAVSDECLQNKRAPIPAATMASATRSDEARQPARSMADARARENALRVLEALAAADSAVTRQPSVGGGGGIVHAEVSERLSRWQPRPD